MLPSPSRGVCLWFTGGRGSNLSHTHHHCTGRTQVTAVWWLGGSGREGGGGEGGEGRQELHLGKYTSVLNIVLDLLTYPALVRRQHRGVVTGVVFSPDGRRLFSASSSGSLAMYDSEQQACPIIRVLANVVVKGEEFGPKALSLSDDGKRLLFVGPLPYTITVVDTTTLNEVSTTCCVSIAVV